MTVGVYVNVGPEVEFDGENRIEAVSVMGLFAPTVALSLTLNVTKTVMKAVPELVVTAAPVLTPRYHNNNNKIN